MLATPACSLQGLIDFFHWRWVGHFLSASLTVVHLHPMTSGRSDANVVLTVQHMLIRLLVQYCVDLVLSVVLVLL